MPSVHPRRKSKGDLLGPGTMEQGLPPRSTTALSFQSQRKDALPGAQDPIIARLDHWEGPPLFQVYPQAIKFGIGETSNADNSAALSLQKSRNLDRLQMPRVEIEVKNSGAGRREKEVRRPGKLQRHPSAGLVVFSDLRKKLFVLCTTGHVLQYSAKGTSDRIPERVLLLGKQSAAFACDLVAGKPYVLQIMQSNDSQKNTVAAPTSIFARMGLRNTSSRRLMPSMLLILENATELDSWMVAIRQHIAALGGNQVRPDTTVRRNTDESIETLARSRTPTHHYQIRRDPSRISVIHSPVNSSQQLASPITGVHHGTQKAVEGSPKKSNNSDSMSLQSRYSVARRSTDTASATSTPHTSPEHQSMKNPRKGCRNSPSTAKEYAPPISHPSDTGSMPELSPVKSSVAVLSSYDHHPTVRVDRCELLLSSDDPHEKLPSSVMIAAYRAKSVAWSRDKAKQQPSARSQGPHAVSSPNKRASSFALEASLTAPDPNQRSSNSLPATAQDSEETGRPDSFIADLPSHTLSPTRPPGTRPPPVFINGTSPVLRASSQPSPNITEPSNSRRHSSMPLKIPLQINTNVTRQRPLGSHFPSQTTHSIALNPRTVPSGTTLIGTRASNKQGPLPFTLRGFPAGAHPEGSPRTRASHKPAPLPLPIRRSVVHSSPVSTPTPQNHAAGPTLNSASFPDSSTGRAPASRLSLFPSPSPPASALRPSLRRSPSTGTFSHSQSQDMTNGYMLRRPASLAVRSDPAPFLASVRSTNATNSRIYTPTSTALLIDPTQQRKTNPNASLLATVLTVPSPTLPPAEHEILGDLPLQGTRGGSRQTTRRAGSGCAAAALPALDLGMPVVGLGPPAPPPCLPLPQVPGESRPGTPANALGASA